MKISGWSGYAMKNYNPVCKLAFHQKREIGTWAKIAKMHISLKQGKYVLMKFWTLIGINILCYLKLFSGP